MDKNGTKTPSVPLTFAGAWFTAGDAWWQLTAATVPFNRATGAATRFIAAEKKKEAAYPVNFGDIPFLEECAPASIQIAQCDGEGKDGNNTKLLFRGI